MNLKAVFTRGFKGGQDQEHCRGRGFGKGPSERRPSPELSRVRGCPL